MKTLLLSCVAVLGLAVVGCCDDERHASSYESATVDTKDMAPRHHHQDNNP